ncbi:hypothetical protein EDB92DRAFT_1798131 [Lactarius akahatsu]|uniref:Uncharacterized protein n=1 Tax=Lactarius akahatsu TaxID=416441 RepID=A0AAD4LH38_9AGAM|nr:hypothetical protein EDB92DRAFT_1798131 [Lactarius akahatsu]
MVPALLAVSASEGINILQNTLLILSTLQENVHTIQVVLDPVEAITIPSHPALPIIHIHLRSASTSVSAKLLNPATPILCDALSFDIVGEERLLQDIVDEVLAQGIWTTWVWWLHRQELVKVHLSIWLAIMAVLSCKECVMDA